MNISKVIQPATKSVETESGMPLSAAKGSVEPDFCSSLFAGSCRGSTIDAIKKYCLLTSLKEEIANAPSAELRSVLQAIYSESATSGNDDKGIDMDSRYQNLLHLLQKSDRLDDKASGFKKI